MNPKCLCFALFFLVVQTSFAQTENESFYAFKADWSAAASIDKCTYFMHEIKKSDTEYVCRYYNKLGPMIKQEVYKDSALSIANGFFCWYNEKGKIDSCGLVANFKKDSYWYYFIGDSLKPTYYDKYDNGKLIRPDTSHKSDTLKVEDDPTKKEAIFKGGVSSWTRYISSNLKVPDRFNQTQKPGRYTITVSFTINKSGKVQDVVLLSSVEWSADAVIFQLLENSPTWQPAIQNGQPVLYMQKQNIVLQVSR